VVDKHPCTQGCCHFCAHGVRGAIRSNPGHANRASAEAHRFASADASNSLENCRVLSIHSGARGAIRYPAMLQGLHGRLAMENARHGIILLILRA
jgi:hypothetical protein